METPSIPYQKSLVNAIALQFTSGQLDRQELLFLRGCLDDILDLYPLNEEEERLVRIKETMMAIKSVRDRFIYGLLQAKKSVDLYQRKYILEKL